MKKILLPCILILLFFIMLLDASTTFSGALNGLNLWLFTVVPSLLPYMIISSYMTENGTFRYLSKLLSPITKHLFHLSEDCGYVILLGFLCGYPIGSKLAADLVVRGRISRTEGQLLLAFCNNVSPAFLATFFIQHVLGLTGSHSILLFSIMGIPFIFGCVLSRTYMLRQKDSVTTKITASSVTGHSVDYCIVTSFENCFKLGGYIILFSILNMFLHTYVSLSPHILCRICSLTEITSGLSLYQNSSLDFSQKLAECAAFTAFGGFCCLAQTYSMIHGSGLKISLYFLSKLTLSIIAYLFFSLI